MNYSKLFDRFIIAAWLLAIIAYPRPSHAYLDPGTGSYFLQVGLALVLGGLVAIRAYFSRIKNAVAKLFARRKPDQPE